MFLDFTGSLDVIGHELTHGVTGELSGLEYHNQPGALNESFSDVFGSLVKQYKLKQTASAADWLIGHGILGPTVKGKALRSMKDPGTAYDDPRLGGRDPQPGHMRDYVHLPDDQWDDFGGVHINSGIPNRAFYLAATNLGGYAYGDAGAIWYEALGTLQPQAQFADCAAATLQVAQAHFGAQHVAALKDAWQQVGVTAATGLASGARRSQGAGEPAGDSLEIHLQRLVTDLQNLVAALRQGVR